MIPPLALYHLILTFIYVLALGSDLHCCAFGLLLQTSLTVFSWLGPMWAPGHNAPLIRFLISALYIYCLLVYHLSFFFTFFLTYLLPYLSFPLRIDLLRFQARFRKRRLHLALLFCVYLVL